MILPESENEAYFHFVLEGFSFGWNKCIVRHEYTLDDLTVYSDGVASFLVSEFMEASWINIQVDSGQILRYVQDLYDVSLRLFAANRSGAILSHPTFL